MFTKINTKINEGRDEEGFTLIELLVVILIIGILAAIAIPVFLNQQKAAVKGGIKSDVRNTATNVATSLVTSPSATGFTTYAAGTTAPTVTGGAVAVQTVNSGDDTVTITKNPASGAAPSTGAGAGQWDDYQIVGTSARVPNYCFVFSSISGKYTEYNDCTVPAGADAGSGTGGSTSTPTTPATTTPATTTPAAPVTTVLKTYTFESAADFTGWSGTTRDGTSAPNAHGGTHSLYYAYAAKGTYYVTPPSRTYVVGQTYTVSAWVFNEAGYNSTTQLVAQNDATTSSPVISATNVWTQVSVTFVAKTTTPSINFVGVMTAGVGGYMHIDDVTISQTS